MHRYATGILGCLCMTFAAQSQANDTIISEVRVGLLAHDVPITSTHVESGVDFNIELLSKRLPKIENLPKIIAGLLSPWLHLGGSINSDNNTHKAYWGFTWNVNLGESYFFQVALGGVGHSGFRNDRPAALRTSRKSLGCTFMFREALELGVRLTERLSTSVMLDHISNVGLCPKNAGLDTIGSRLSWSF